MDLSTLRSTLPPGLADAERDMGDKFRAAALSITNLYKSSLGYTKQAYNVGYSAALADVLSTVQSSIGAGQDAEQTLSRLMDWADARQAAISAFAAEDTDDLPVPAPITKRPTAIPRNSHLNPINRPASAPIPSQPSTTSKADSQPIASTSRNVQPLPSTSNTTTPSTNTLDSPSVAGYQPTPGGVMSSSPMASPSNNHHRSNFSALPKPSKNLPSRYSQLNLNASGSGTSSGHVPSTTFNPTLPSAGVPFVSFTNNTNASDEGPAQNYPTGTKRPMIDSMEIDQVIPIPPSSTNTSVTAVPVAIQTPPNRSGRSAKRRSMGNNLGANDQDNNEKDKDKDRERKRGNRRGHGNGPGTSAV
ncbi:hypothetical protein I204_02443 [Kwoniella mangroviensis CBS 8886]|nr:hypothetical protein I204_02443 [Kwoniella mangroviensis CBS 8886]